VGASDIHLGRNSGSEDGYRYLIRFRVNGSLQMMKSKFINEHYDEVISRIKVLAKLDTNAVGETQDGQITLNADQPNFIVLRISILPGFQRTEEVCIRIQKAEDKDITLDQLVMTTTMRERIERLIRQRSGMVILNGPAGSGKTTTVYAILRKLASPHRKIITAEDPVEMEVPYVNHVQVNPKASFADLSRCFMRQDAEIIFIGEIRDESSAIAAQQLAQIGHLVFSTLHTRDSIGVISRLEAFGVHPNFISNTLIGSLAQRLAPGLCQNCKIEHQIDGRLREQLNKILPMPDDVKIYRRGKGCDDCSIQMHGVETTSGYAGRIPIYELLVVDEEIGDMINS